MDYSSPNSPASMGPLGVEVRTACVVEIEIRCLGSWFDLLALNAVFVLTEEEPAVELDGGWAKNPTDWAAFAGRESFPC